MNNPDCEEFVASDLFKIQFDKIMQHDREMFEEPKGWQIKPVEESPLLKDFSIIWGQIKAKYQTELSALAYRAIPNEGNIARSFIKLTNRIR